MCLTLCILCYNVLEAACQMQQRPALSNLRPKHFDCVPGQQTARWRWHLANTRCLMGHAVLFNTNREIRFQYICRQGVQSSCYCIIIHKSTAPTAGGKEGRVTSIPGVDGPLGLWCWSFVKQQFYPSTGYIKSKSCVQCTKVCIRHAVKDFQTCDPLGRPQVSVDARTACVAPKESEWQ